jgi:hypothetical protein
MNHWKRALVVGLAVVLGGASATGAAAHPAAHPAAGPAADPGGLAELAGAARAAGAPTEVLAAGRKVWDGLSQQGRKAALAEFQKRVGPAVRAKLDAEKARRGAAAAAAAGPRSIKDVLSGKAQQRAAGKPTFRRSAPPPARPATGGVTTLAADLDGDQLDQAFEAQVADAFTPYYHVSTGERGGTGFATFQNSVPQTVAQVFGPTPPISHFRVQPLGFSTLDTGVQVGVLRIDYLTLWNRDDGLPIDSGCEVFVAFIDSLFGRAAPEPHNLDNERSAALVAAPVPASGVYNPDPNAYSLYSFYTAAYELEAYYSDNSAFYIANPPAPAGSHVQLGLSRSTHATYAGNPNSVPVVHPYFIEFTFVVLLDLYYFGQISFEEYAFYLYLADVALNECLVEDFTDQGGMFAPSRTDVGEPAQPINGAGFIQDANTGIRAILDAPLWTVS